MADAERYRAAERALWASLGVEATERELDVVGLDGHLRITEAGAGPLLVFIHGGSSAGASWASLVARLDGYRCVLVDRPGCGLSPPRRTDVAAVADLEAYADAFVPAVIEALGVEAAPVVATSFGPAKLNSR